MPQNPLDMLGEFLAELNRARSEKWPDKEHDAIIREQGLSGAFERDLLSYWSRAKAIGLAHEHGREQLKKAAVVALRAYLAAERVHG